MNKLSVSHRYIEGILLAISIMISASILQSLGAREISIKSEQRFDRYVIHNDLVAVLFYEKSKEMRKNLELRGKTEDMLRIFGSVSEKYTYKEANFVFVTVNVSDESLRNIASHLGISTFPAVVLFNGGRAVRDRQGGVAYIQGFVSRGELQEFIDSYLSERIEDVIEEKEYKRKREREERSYYDPYPYYYPYYSPYSYGYWPYYGGGFYGRGFGGHVGIHFGGGGRGGRRGGGHRGGGQGRRK